MVHMQFVIVEPVRLVPQPGVPQRIQVAADTSEQHSGTRVALATVASDTDCAYGPAGRMAANTKPKDRVLVEVHIGHTEIMPPWTG